MLADVERTTDNRYSAYGIIAGRPFVADGETVEEAQNERQVLKAEVELEVAKTFCLYWGLVDLEHCEVEL